MKKPKEPKTFKRPRLYYQPISVSNEDTGILRIIYPNGDTEWSYSVDDLVYDYTPIWAPGPSCWARPDFHPTGHTRLAQMHAYDALLGFPPAEFLGEL